jgi:hypothetical protein
MRNNREIFTSGLNESFRKIDSREFEMRNRVVKLIQAKLSLHGERIDVSDIYDQDGVHELRLALRAEDNSEILQLEMLDGGDTSITVRSVVNVPSMNGRAVVYVLNIPTDPEGEIRDFSDAQQLSGVGVRELGSLFDSLQSYERCELIVD